MNIWIIIAVIVVLIIVICFLIGYFADEYLTKQEIMHESTLNSSKLKPDNDDQPNEEDKTKESTEIGISEINTPALTIEDNSKNIDTPTLNNNAFNSETILTNPDHNLFDGTLPKDELGNIDINAGQPPSYKSDEEIYRGFVGTPNVGNDTSIKENEASTLDGKSGNSQYSDGNTNIVPTNNTPL